MKRAALLVSLLAACGGTGSSTSPDASNAPHPDASNLPHPDASNLPHPDATPGSPDAKPAADAGATACTVTLSGDITATFACGVAAAYNASQDQSAVSWSPQGTLPSSVVSFAAAFTLAGDTLTNKTYSDSDYKQENCAAISSSFAIYQSAKNVNGTADAGTLTVNITDISIVTQDSSGKIFTIHGTADGTLPGTSGSVTMHIDF